MSKKHFPGACIMATCLVICFLGLLIGCESEFLTTIKTIVKEELPDSFSFSLGITLDGTGSGVIDELNSTANGSYDEGTAISCKATATSGSTFSGWYDAATGGSLVSMDNPLSFNLSQNTSLYSDFTDSDPPYEYDYGNVSGDSDYGTVDSDEPAGSYPNLTSITIEATANSGYTFTGWYDAQTGGTSVSTENPYTFNLVTDTELYAEFSDNLDRIVFVSDRDGTVTEDREVYTINSDGSAILRLTDNSTAEQDPNWRPDKLKILYVDNQESTFGRRIYIMNPDGSSNTCISGDSTGQNHYLPDYSPDGSQLACTRYYPPYDQIMTMAASGGTETRIAEDNYTDDAAPDWNLSTEGPDFVFMSKTDTRIDFDIYTMNSDGSQNARITNNFPIDDRYPVWSPDGSKIVFQSTASDTNLNSDGGDFDIFVMDADGSNVVQLTDNASIEDQRPDWSPDGTKIVFQSEATDSDLNILDTDYDIFIMDAADGGNVTQVTDNSADDIYPNW